MEEHQPEENDKIGTDPNCEDRSQSNLCKINLQCNEEEETQYRGQDDESKTNLDSCDI